MSARVELYRETVQVGPFAHDGSDWDNPTRPGKWRWRFVKNGRIMADSGQGYRHRGDAVHGACVVLGVAMSHLSAVEMYRRSPVTGRFDLIPIIDLTRERAS